MNSTFLFWPLNFLKAMLVLLFSRFVKRSRDEAWVIGSHRGRLYADNSAALHEFILRRTKQEIIWIASDETLLARFKEQKIRALKKDTFAARLAMLKAPVLVYSHGEDDIDSFMRYFRGKLGLRIFLNHSQNFLKTGYAAVPEFETLGEGQKRKFLKRVCDFDYLLAGSEFEKQFLERAFPHKAQAILPKGGAAHLDTLKRDSLMKLEHTTFLWFPTFRDENERETLLKTVKEVLGSRELIEYLELTDSRFVLVPHVNSRLNLLSFSPCIKILKAHEISEALATASVFISDYSGTIFDWLFLNRPFIHFMFDYESYTKRRSFYLDPFKLNFGKVCVTAEELVQEIVSENWKRVNLYETSRESLRQRAFPDTSYGFAERCYKAILELAK